MSIGALAAIFGTSFLVGLTGALSPGPLTTLAVREGVRRGFWAGPLLAVGHGAVELVLVIGLALGLGRVIGHDAVAAAIAVAGGLFLLWLGWQVIRTAPHQEMAIAEMPASSMAREGSARGGNAGLVAAAMPPSIGTASSLAGMGIAMSLSNPFWFVWWATIGTAYIATALDQGAAGVASFYSGHVLADLGWLTLIAFALATSRRIIGGRVYRGLLAACGVFLLGLGGWFLWSASEFVA